VVVNTLATFLAMGGYARFVWPAYGLAAAVLLGMTVWTLGSYRRRQKELAQLQREAPEPRRR
jgi:heme exporter protein D